MTQKPQPIAEPVARFGSLSESFTTRPVIAATRGVVAAGHYLAATAGLRMLHLGGNAIDAGVAMGFCSAVLEPQLDGVGGESPILIYEANTRRVVVINGQGVAPRLASIDWFRSRGMRLIPGDGLLAATVPSQVDSWITALAQFGSLPLEAVLMPAVEFARDGFPVSHGLRGCVEACATRYREQWPGSSAIYLPDDRVPEWGRILRNPDWADTFQTLIDTEREHANLGRIKALEKARDVFYCGAIAERIAEFCRDTKVLDATNEQHAGLLSYEDLAAYHARVEPPITVDYRGLDVHKCGPWSQGPVFCQQLRLLEGFDLSAMGHNHPAYIHTWIECAKLAFADREFYYGDPDFVSVPLERLLSREYAEQRRDQIDLHDASTSLRPGDAAPRPMKLVLGDERSYAGDTTHVCAIDAQGNMMAATPSGGWIPSSPVIPGLGFPLGTRGQMFSLDPEHPNALQGGKRPRTTLTPTLVTHRGRPCMVFGTPGGDQQDQWTLQFFLNMLHFDMNVQAALDAPTFHTEHFPSSFYPRAQHPGRLVIEEAVPLETRVELARRGHDVRTVPAWSHGRVLGICTDIERGLIMGGASPRAETGYALGW